jgi:hypothetical protein
MSYNPLEQRDHMYYQDPSAFNQYQPSYELRSTALSFTSYKSDFISHATPVPQGIAGDYQHLLQPPPQNASGSEWNPGFWRRFPVLPILALLGVLASIYNPESAGCEHF